MKEEFWHSLVADKSFLTLQELKGKFDFVLIGGWAVFVYTKALKSKDIDIVVEAPVLGQLKTQYEVIKNSRLKKYEIKCEGFDIDIYLCHWSTLGIPAEDILKSSLSLDGYRVPCLEILFILKLYAYSQRKGSLKGKKDTLDILSLLWKGEIDLSQVKNILQKNALESLCDELKFLLSSLFEVPELEINQKKYADFKKKIFKKI